MRMWFSLLGLAVCGGAVISLPDHFFGFYPSPGVDSVGLWMSSVQIFAVPLVLLVLGSSKTANWLRLIWGAWIGISTISVLKNLEQTFPAMTPYGWILLLLVLAFSLGAVLSAAINLSPKKETPKK